MKRFLCTKQWVLIAFVGLSLACNHPNTANQPSADNPTDQQTGSDHIRICKSDALPPDRLIVGEFESPECEPLGSKNAWDTAVPRDGLTSCQSIKPASGFASVIQLVICERVYAPNCPEQKDGTFNGYIWRSPEECEKRQNLPVVTKLRAICNTSGIQLKEDEYILAQTTSSRCALHRSRFENVSNTLILRDYGAQQSLAITSCVDSSGRPLGKELLPVDVILRRFSSKYCPHPGMLNAIMFKHYGRDIAKRGVLPPFPKGVIYCSGSPLIDSYRSDFVQIHDPSCGGEEKSLNAYKLRPSDLPDCLVGQMEWRLASDPSRPMYVLQFTDDTLYMWTGADKRWFLHRSGSQWVDQTGKNLLDPISCKEISWNNGQYKLVR